MGTVNAAAMAEAVAEGRVGLRSALAWHLSSNHYPPVPLSMIDPCIAAINAAVEAYTDGDEDLRDLDRPIDLPEGIFYKGHSTAPAAAVVEQHHLEFFVEAQLYGDEEYE